MIVVIVVYSNYIMNEGGCKIGKDFNTKLTMVFKKERVVEYYALSNFGSSESHEDMDGTEG